MVDGGGEGVNVMIGEKPGLSEQYYVSIQEVWREYTFMLQLVV